MVEISSSVEVLNLPTHAAVLDDHVYEIPPPVTKLWSSARTRHVEATASSPPISDRAIFSRVLPLSCAMRRSVEVCSISSTSVVLVVPIKKMRSLESRHKPVALSFPP